MLPGSFKPAGFVTIALATDNPSSIAPPAGCSGALIQASGGNVAWRDDGVAPTSGSGGGMLLIDGNDPSWFSGDLTVIQFIAVGASTALLVAYYA